MEVLLQTIDEALEVELLKIVEELKQRHIDLGQKASGKWIDSLEVVVSNGKGLIYAEHYTEYLTKGRKPGRKPPINPIEEWVKVKLNKSGKEALNIAWAVAIKIGREGTEIHKSGGSDLVDGVITEERISKLYDDVGRVVTFKISENILRNI